MDHDDAFDDEDFDFSDSGLDALPADALQQLEATAIRATQQQYQAQDEAEYGYHVGNDEVAEHGQAGYQDEVIDLNNHATNPLHQPGQLQQLEGNTYNHVMEVDEPPQRSQADPNQLLLRIKRLEQEKARLAREVQTEKSRLLLKTGETETARRRLEAVTRENDRKVAALQQAHNEALLKHRAEVEKLLREREQAQTNAMFLEQDLMREADKSKRMKHPTREGVPLRPRQAGPGTPSVTPRRQQKTLPLGDGFADEDMVIVSPTKGKERPKALTPKQPAKRKRNVADQSPVPALQLSEPRPKAPAPTIAVETLGPLLEGLKEDDRRFELLQALITYRVPRDGERLLEALTHYAVPSQPEKKLSSKLFDELSTCSLEPNADQLAVRICENLCSTWDQCLQEKYYAPVYLLLDAIQLVLAYSPCSSAVAITERAIPTLLASVDLVAFPIARACMNYTTPAELYSPAQRKINSEIDVVGCLDLLHLIATSCITSKEATSRFWQCIPIDFPLHLLRKAQPLPYIQRMLRLLSTSNLPDSIGPRVLATFGLEQQEKRETDLIDRLTKLLSDVPEPIPEPALEPNASPPQPTSYSTREILELRLQILDLLTTFSISHYGSHRLASLRYCLGRLIKHLNTQVSSLYAPNPMAPTRPLTVAAINATMKLIFHLKNAVPELDIKAKLNAVPGGAHAYLVALTRLAFSERLVLEEGIEKEVVDAAYAILDSGLTPEEGEGLLQVFSSGATV